MRPVMTALSALQTTYALTVNAKAQLHVRLVKARMTVRVDLYAKMDFA